MFVEYLKEQMLEQRVLPQERGDQTSRHWHSYRNGFHVFLKQSVGNIVILNFHCAHCV